MARLSATSRQPEEYAAATQLAREVRERVGEQVRELIVEGDRQGGRAEVAQRIQRLIEAEREIEQAKGRQLQAEREGLPQQPHRHDELEGRDALRSAVVGLAAACGAWAASMDHAMAAAQRNGSVSAEPAPA